MDIVQPDVCAAGGITECKKGSPDDLFKTAR
jgi:L-alanine-DL-glutamate epimerase-like enolase superfamily enzyme